MNRARFFLLFTLSAGLLAQTTAPAEAPPVPVFERQAAGMLEEIGFDQLLRISPEQRRRFAHIRADKRVAAREAYAQLRQANAPPEQWQRSADDLRQRFDDELAELLRDWRTAEIIAALVESGNVDQLVQAAHDAGLAPDLGQELRRKILAEQTNIESVALDRQFEQRLEKIPPEQRDEMRAEMVARQRHYEAVRAGYRICRQLNDWLGDERRAALDARLEKIAVSGPPGR